MVLPAIIPKQIDNVAVQNNAILDFTVDEYVIPNAATIYLDSTLQISSEFGSANILQWRPDMTIGQIDKAFGTGEGQIGLTILRLRIPPDANSFRYNVPTAQEVYSLGAEIIASPWSPPASMKTNNNTTGGHIYGGGIGSYPLAESKGKEVWMTEHLDADTTWTDVFARGKEIKYNDFCIGITVLPFPVDSLNGRSEK